LVEPEVKRVFRIMAWFLAVIAVAVVAVVLWKHPHTPPVRDDDGREIPGAIASLEQVELGGVGQWILVRGQPGKPIVLFLHGGPGMPMMWMAGRIQRPLEDEFLLVHWDQRGAGKSFADLPPVESMTDERILSDALELVILLRQRFGEERVILVGHSWGTYIGTLFAQRHPNLLHAYVGIGQVTGGEPAHDVTDAWLRRRAAELDRPEAIADLDERGSSAREKWLFEFGGELQNETGYLPFIWTGLKAPEYGISDVAAVAKGSSWSSEHLREIAITEPLESAVRCLPVPVFLFLGRTDYVAPSELAARWLEEIQAPLKRAVWFERSSHFPHYEEPGAFQEALRGVWQEVEGRAPTPEYCPSEGRR
jgi:pimeloyl-ACP methyl ester carboxylesterase